MRLSLSSALILFLKRPCRKIIQLFAKAAMACDILICCGQTASQLLQPRQAPGCFSAGRADRAMGAEKPPPVKRVHFSESGLCPHGPGRERCPFSPLSNSCLWAKMNVFALLPILRRDGQLTLPHYVALFFSVPRFRPFPLDGRGLLFTCFYFNFITELTMP